MKDLIIKKDLSTPLVKMSASEGVLLIEGRSIPENPEAFYEPVIQWIRQYFESAVKPTRLDLKLEYVNSGTSKYLMEMLRTIKKYHDEGKECLVNWYYEEEDESMYELGSHYKEAVSLPFRLNIMYD
jgi:hypothetical protein